MMGKEKDCTCREPRHGTANAGSVGDEGGLYYITSFTCACFIMFSFYPFDCAVDVIIRVIAHKISR